MPEKELIYVELARPEKPGPPRRPIARGRSTSETEIPTVYAEIDFNIKTPSPPKQIRHHSREIFPPPPSDIYDQFTPGDKPHPVPHYEATDGVPKLPPKFSLQSKDFPPPPPDKYSQPTRRSSHIDESEEEDIMGFFPGRPATIPAPVPPRRYTSVFYPATPALKPPQTKPRDPACNFVGLSDERDIKPKDPVLLKKYAPINQVQPDPVFEYDKIYGLRKRNIDLFLKCRDVAMILFYNPEDLGKRPSLEERYVHAASITSRYNHAFATVNCWQERMLCDLYKITKTPVFSVFTLNNLVGSFRDSNTDPETLKRYVENVPLIK